ncbi:MULTISPECIES: TIGR01841 family phasin [unclassified Methylobacterium]|jgi:phasin family protein|uniref:TIGR01841 family phasin n=1 Tax=unclassified Methylobacterium TaxID=2615210 RepID=UPI001354097F|nr:TIGR01841 family phasin [Methylobacterium sp. 2A]MWV25943.1 phasin family protein [Methylobacterium sp. 2A]
MPTRDALPPFPYPAGFGTPWRRLGVAGRAAQTLGIEWADSLKQGLDDIAATAGTLAASRNPAEILAIQSAYLQRAGARLSARSAVTADLITALTADLLRPPPAPPAARAH